MSYIRDALSNIGALVVLFILLGAVVGPFWRIFRRLGCYPALALLMWLPLVNFAVLYYVAWSKRPYPAGTGK